jgi:hypothetical protein
MWLAVIAGDPATTPATIANDALARRDWVAIDDTDIWFPPGCRQLLHVDGGHGLTTADLTMLEVQLADHRLAFSPAS